MPPESPQKIISDRNIFEIISPGKGIRIHLSIAPDNTVTTRVAQIKSRREQQLAATTHFTRVTRQLIHSMIALDAAKMMLGSEEISPEMEVNTYQNQFENAIRELAGMSFSDRAVKRLISVQGKLLTEGQNHIGVMSSIVKEKVVSLSDQVSGIYLEMAESASCRTIHPIR